MEVRGGNGYIEDWVNPRLVRDAHVGLLWEGTSNINALDVILRAVGKAGGHRALQAMLRRRLGNASPLPEHFRNHLEQTLDRAVQLAEKVARTGSEPQARRAATALYDAASAVLLAWEGSRPGADARRVLLARMVIDHRLSPQDPLELEDASGEDAAINLLLDEAPLTLDRVALLLAG